MRQLWNAARGAVILAAVGLALWAYAAYQQFAEPYWLNVNGVQKNFSAAPFTAICNHLGSGAFSDDPTTFSGACSAASRASGQRVLFFILGLVVIVLAAWWARRRIRSPQPATT